MALPRFNIFNPATGVSRNTDNRDEAQPGEVVIERCRSQQEIRIEELEAEVNRLKAAQNTGGTP